MHMSYPFIYSIIIFEKSDVTLVVLATIRLILHQKKDVTLGTEVVKELCVQICTGKWCNRRFNSVQEDSYGSPGACIRG